METPAQSTSIHWHVVIAIAGPLLLIASWYMAERSELLNIMDKGDTHLEARLNTISSKLISDRQTDAVRTDQIRLRATARVSELEKKTAVLEEKMSLLIIGHIEKERDVNDLKVRAGVIENTLSLKIFQRPGQPTTKGAK